MSTGAVIVIVAAAVIVLLLLAWAVPRMRNRRNEQLRSRADEERYEGRNRQLRAEQEQATADERAARAKRQAAEAEQHAREAAREREIAGGHIERARELDPDVDQDDDQRNGDWETRTQDREGPVDSRERGTVDEHDGTRTRSG
jgi:hypothetical protein